MSYTRFAAAHPPADYASLLLREKQASRFATHVQGSFRAALPNEQQQKIRRAIKLNERKARTQSGRYRGRRWLQGKQAQCAIFGHTKDTRSHALGQVLPGVCYYCGAKME